MSMRMGVPLKDEFLHEEACLTHIWMFIIGGLSRRQPLQSRTFLSGFDGYLKFQVSSWR